jgi:plasmid replication initiation protein
MTQISKNLSFKTNSSETATSVNGRQPGLPAIARDEMNLAEFPLTVLSTRVNTEVKTLEFKDSIRGKSGELIEREWIITGADKFGLPTATDDDVILGLMCLTMDQGFRNRKVYFSRYELLKILRWTTEGRSYSRLSKSLDRLSGVRIRSSNAFFDNSQKGFQTCNFGIIDAYEIKDTRGSKDKSYFIWSEMMFDSFQSGFIKKIDLDFYFSLKSSVSRRLYRYLDKHFYHRSTVEKPLLTLAFEKIGLSRSYQYVSSIKQQIEPAGEELIERGFLKSFQFQGRGALTTVQFVSGTVNTTDERLRPNLTAQTEISHAPAEDVFTQKNLKREMVKNKLQQNGLTLFQANKLLNRKSDEELLEVEKTISKYESVQKEQFSNPVGFLYRAVEDASKFQVINQAPKSAQKQVQSLRPERRAVEASNVVVSGPKQLDAEKTTRAKEALAALPKAELAKLRQETGQKLGILKSILEADKFEEALNGCMIEEMKRKI